MLKVTNTTVTKEASVKTGDFEYSVIYSAVNGVIALISCSVRKEIDGVINEVGNIRKENGQVNSFIREDEDYVSHLTQFRDIVSELAKIEG